VSGTVWVAHVVDTEGPLYESLEAKFQRVEELFGPLGIEPSSVALRAIQDGNYPFPDPDLGRRVAHVLSGHRSKVFGSWAEIESMLGEFLSSEFRQRYCDPNGEPWTVTWHCLDHVGFARNPRHRDHGMYNVFDRYVEFLRDSPHLRDDIEWHCHAVSTFGDAHRCATHYLRDGIPYRILADKVVNRNWFPSTFRAGCQSERPDIHAFLEQWLPFDISNMAVKQEDDEAPDYEFGQLGDWRGAPTDWSIYTPSHDDYRVPGSCRRRIARALNPLNRLGRLTRPEVSNAYKTASDGNDVILGIASHDWRDLRREVRHVHELLRSEWVNWPTVSTQFVTSRDAFINACDLRDDEPMRLEAHIESVSSSQTPRLVIRQSSGQVFGAQPFLAMRLVTGEVIHDNLDRPEDKVWSYAFTPNTLPIGLIDRIAVAANSAGGSTCVIAASGPLQADQRLMQTYAR